MISVIEYLCLNVIFALTKFIILFLTIFYAIFSILNKFTLYVYNIVVIHIQLRECDMLFSKPSKQIKI